MGWGSVIWLEQAVPLFLFVTAFLVFKRQQNQEKPLPIKNRRDFLKILKRLFVPFIAFESLIIIYALATNTFSLKHFILSAGIGMGSYYPWLYLQFWLILPFAHRLFIRSKANIFVAVFISTIPEVLFTSILSTFLSQEILDSIWRVFAGRYIFIMYMAYLVANEMFTLKKFMLTIFASVVFIIISRYQLLDLYPLFFTTSHFAWNGVHWPMFFYTCFLFTILYKNLSKVTTNRAELLSWVGENSWMIFLSQMLFFTLFSRSDIPVASGIIATVLFAAFGFSFCFITAHLISLISARLRKLRKI